MTPTNERLVQNQRNSRYANERLQESVAFVADGRSVPFLCECADDECLGRIEATLDDYQAAHLFREDYFILRGHQRSRAEEIMEQLDGFDIVRKPAA